MFLICLCLCVHLSVCHSSPQTLMAGSNPMLGCSPGINLSGILPSGGLMPSALPTMQPAASAGIPFSLHTDCLNSFFFMGCVQSMYTDGFF